MNAYFYLYIQMFIDVLLRGVLVEVPGLLSEENAAINQQCWQVNEGLGGTWVIE